MKGTESENEEWNDVNVEAAMCCIWCEHRKLLTARQGLGGELNNSCRRSVDPLLVRGEPALLTY